MSLSTVNGKTELAMTDEEHSQEQVWMVWTYTCSADIWFIKYNDGQTHKWVVKK